MLLICITFANGYPIATMGSAGTSSGGITVVCIGTTEYIIFDGDRKAGITVALNKDGKPIQCKVD